MTTDTQNHSVVYKAVRPELTITYLRGTSTQRGYHESWYEVIARHPLDEGDLKRLDECGVLGMGQDFWLEKTETITDTVPAVTVDKRTGEVLPDVPPVAYNGAPITNTVEYTYQKYTIKRICDSGD